MYFVITNETYNNFQFKPGLNIFDDSQCYFADKENIHTSYGFGCWIRLVVAPNNSKIIKHCNFNTDKIIVSNEFQLYSLKTIIKFNLNITDLYISEVCKRGKANILEWWKNSGLELKYNESALNWASSFGHVNVLEWWKKSGLELKYTASALNSASQNGQVEVLEWWKNSGLELKQLKHIHALNSASLYGQVEVLEWWKNSGL
jgi:ankyrin repeat protein